MRITYRRLSLALLPLLLLGPAVAACGGDDDPPPSPPAAAAEPEPAAAQSDAPAEAEDTGQAGIAADVGSVRNGIEIISLTGDGQGDPAQDGDSVGVRYRGTLDDGSEFDSNAGGALLPVTIGAGRVIPGFDEALRGLRIGETIVVRIPPDLAYGERDESLVIEIPRAQTPPGMTVGQRVQFGGGVPGVITEITDEAVIVDANHELAGQALTFEISIETLE
ncbi:MAG: hypothetical protein F4Y94_02960 [Chloroflexi bacterium]|nr:hypothetical protein [Chloroflexota bacterium]